MTCILNTDVRDGAFAGAANVAGLLAIDNPVLLVCLQLRGIVGRKLSDPLLDTNRVAHVL